MRLTPNFTLAELTVSAIAEREGLDNTPPPEVIARLQLVAFGLESIRRLVGGPIRVTSAYRSPAVNAAAKGTKTSDHLSGWAADIVRPGITPLALARAIADSPLAFDQMILEADRGVVHISFDPALTRRVQTQKGGAGKPLQSGLIA